MKRTTYLYILACFSLLFLPRLSAQQAKNIQKDYTGALTESFSVPAGKSISGAGTFDFHLGTVTLPGSLASVGITNGATLDSWGAKAVPAGVVVGTTDVQTLGNKTISGASNTLTAIPNTALTNSAITIAGTSTSLGGSITLDTIDNGLAANGLIARIGTNARAARTITGTANQITVTNGDGVAGNPTVGIPTNPTLLGSLGLLSSSTPLLLGTSGSTIIQQVFNTGSSKYFTADSSGNEIFGTNYLLRNFEAGITNASASAANWSGNGQIYFGGATLTDTSTNGTLPAWTNTTFIAPTFAFSNASTITDASTVRIRGNPTAGTNATISNAWGLWNGGNTRLDGVLNATNTTDSTSTTTGGAIFSGGVGIAKALNVGTGTSSFAGPVAANAGVVLPHATVATLPAASSANHYMIYIATDLTSITSGSTATGGGSLEHIVESNGTAWIVQ